MAAVADDQPAKQSPKKRKLTPEEKQYVELFYLSSLSSPFFFLTHVETVLTLTSRAREDVKKAKDEERRIQLQLKEEAKNKKEEERKALALAKEEEKKKKDEEKRIKGRSLPI